MAFPKAKAAVGGPVPERVEAPLRPSQCGVFLRRELANSFRAIVRGFVKQAESGSVPHFKLTTELLEKQAAQRKRKISVHKLWEDLQRAESAAEREEIDLARGSDLLKPWGAAGEGG